MRCVNEIFRTEFMVVCRFINVKEIKDVLAYLRLVINPKDEEALVRVINYPARGIGDTTVEKLTVAANHYKRSIF